MFLSPASRALIGTRSLREFPWLQRAMNWTSSQMAQGRANIDLLKKNYIINGAMMVSQQNGTTAGTTTNYYPVDQFHMLISNGGAISAAQVASVTPSGSPNRLRVTVTTADAAVAAGDYSVIEVHLEGLTVADLMFGTSSAKTIVIQFGVRAPAGTYCIVVGNSPFNRSYVAEYSIAGGEANVDVVKSVVIPGDTTGTWLTTTGIGIGIRFGLMAGSSLQQAAGSWGTGAVVGSANQFNFMGTINNVFELFDVSLTEGTVAPAFMVPDYPSQLTLCQRYWYSLLGPTAGMYIETYGGAGTFNALAFNHPVPMRTAPTGAIIGTFTYGNCGSIAINSTSATGASINVTGSGAVSRLYAFANASSGVSMDARML